MDLDKDIEIVREIKYLELRGKIDGQFVRAEIPEEYKQAIENILSEFEGLRDFSAETVRRNAELQEELETYKKIAEKLAEQVKRDTVFYDTEGISSCDLSEEKYCKCSKHNNGANCKQCIIDWARKEVENGK